MHCLKRLTILVVIYFYLVSFLVLNCVLSKQKRSYFSLKIFSEKDSFFHDVLDCDGVFICRYLVGKENYLIEDTSKNSADLFIQAVLFCRKLSGV